MITRGEHFDVHRSNAEDTPRFTILNQCDPTQLYHIISIHQSWQN